MTSRDKRFLHTPPYAFELGLVAAAVSVWRLLERGALEEDEPDQAGSEVSPADRAQA